jgi:hypothetical protein
VSSRLQFANPQKFPQCRPVYKKVRGFAKRCLSSITSEPACPIKSKLKKTAENYDRSKILMASQKAKKTQFPVIPAFAGMTGRDDT